MGAGKRFMRQIQRNQFRTMITTMTASEPIFVGTAGMVDGIEVEAWRVGPMLMVIPSLTEAEYPPEVLDALDLRRRADLTGRCDCGARWCPADDHGGGLHLCMDHEHDCVAGDDRLAELLDRHRRSGAST
jgi:hypothetical protein